MRWRTLTHGRGNWRMEWVANTLHTTSEHGVSSITTADAHTSAASSRLNWRPRRCKWTRPFRRKTKSGFCACAITFQTQSTKGDRVQWVSGCVFPAVQRPGWPIARLVLRLRMSGAIYTSASPYGTVVCRGTSFPSPLLGLYRLKHLKESKYRDFLELLLSVFIVAPCILKIH
jgi:hypothetical protein